ncbi:uncharacterized protein SPPG_03818 [Spizellomyces punctatus DAOM BR117]|uniref:Uncharacterized protein n=1 Tax=Spizellomyces punctatus (strain DAOM BR117) TaxID=645134 RepID=A0A0L0HHX9_SPIPD|nr:uncharacterized protein SPPG_03818 [Spizellomyces punctatus DAOM BR117]KND00697.1 hypothetical protein SPPG_03818 [Spizellomyces punctatus DAOM BR117]|eukprot:XP_016608736.1 hypothetical protein SPPG_03818 [Spizellomyces punctatus DAOM BR117]
MPVQSYEVVDSDEPSRFAVTQSISAVLYRLKNSAAGRKLRNLVYDLLTHETVPQINLVGKWTATETKWAAEHIHHALEKESAYKFVQSAVNRALDLTLLELFPNELNTCPGVKREPSDIEQYVLADVLNRMPAYKGQLLPLVNRPIVVHNLRKSIWRAALKPHVRRKMPERPLSLVSENSNMTCYAMCQDFLVEHRTLHSLAISFQTIRQMESIFTHFVLLAEATQFPIRDLAYPTRSQTFTPQHKRILASIVPFLTVSAQNELQEDDMVEMVQAFWTRLPFVWREDDRYGMEHIAYEIRMCLKENDPAWYARLIEAGEEDIKDMILLLIGNFFIGICPLHVSIYLLDHLFIASNEFTDQNHLPGVNQWIVWICTALLMYLHVSSGQNDAGEPTNSDLALITIQNRLSNITQDQLHLLMHPIIKDSFGGICEASDPVTDLPTALDDDDESVSEEDLIALEK